MKLSFQDFFGAFLLLFLGLLFNGESAFGCPLTERDFNTSISSSDKSNIAFTPMYLDGVYPARFNLWRAASVETGFLWLLIFWPISKIVNSIPLLYRLKHTDQEGNVKKSDIGSILLHGCIVISGYFFIFYKNSFPDT